jgi:DNA-binding transcriptional ArsR family regulator
MATTQSADPAVTDEGPLSTEAIFETLSNRRRRYTLHYLKRLGEPVPIRDLSEQLAAWENEVGREQVRPKERKRLYTALHQTHLPKMHGLGVVEYDSDRGVVGLTDAIDQFDIYFDLVAADDIPWSQFYLALGSVTTALVTIGALGVQPFASVDGFGYALAVVFLFTVVAGYHTLRDRSRVVGSADVPPETAISPAEHSEAAEISPGDGHS